MTPHQIHPDSPDLAQILPLLKKSFAYMEGRIDPPSSLHRLTGQAIAEQAATGEIWGIGAPLSGVVFLTRKPGCLYLGKLAVDPAKQGQGLGKVLIQTAMVRAKAAGIDTVGLQTRVELIENRRFFENNGFTVVGETAHPGYNRPTSLTLQRSVR